jgi:Ferritin-like domain
MDRRRFLITTIGASAVAVGAPWLAGAAAATDDELAYANFGLSAEFLLKDFYAKALEAKLATGVVRGDLRRGRSAAVQHAKALADLLTGAGETPAVEEDFAFVWPEKTFATLSSVTTTGVVLLRAVLGAYQSAAATVSEPSCRVLYTSLAASIAQQIGALAAASGKAGSESFPAALDLETASAALENYLG